MHYNVENLAKAFEKANKLDYENGMATNPVFVHREYEEIKVIRKCGSPDRPEIYLIIAKPMSGYEAPNTHKLSDDIKDALGLYGDINIKFKPRYNQENTYDCVIGTKPFKE